MLINTGGEEKITKLSKMGGGNRSILLISSLNNGVKCRKPVYVFQGNDWQVAKWIFYLRMITLYFLTEFAVY